MYNEKELIWVSALGAISVFGPCLDVAQFDDISAVLSNNVEFSESMLKKYGTNSDVINKRKTIILEFLGIEHYSIDHSKEKFLNHVFYLLDRDNKDLLSFNSDFYILIKQSESDFRAMVKAKGVFKRAYLEAMKNYSMVIGRNSYYAYNIANAISLLRIAWYLNVINNDTYVKFIMEISRVVKKNFVSYYDYGSQVVAVQDILSKHPDAKDKDFYRLINEDQLAHVMYGLWAHIPWMGRTTV